MSTPSKNSGRYQMAMESRIIVSVHIQHCNDTDGAAVIVKDVFTGHIPTLASEAAREAAEEAYSNWLERRR